MSKINEIQQAMKQLEGGAFQKLCEAYLSQLNIGYINCIGSVLGKDKVRKGTPDSLVALENGKYSFFEITTTEKDIAGKFSDDIDKCFDEIKTGIKIAEIDSIYLFYHDRMGSSDQASLERKCTANGVALNVLGLSELSYELYSKFPGIVYDHLGVEIDTGQIVDLNKFIDLYGKNKLATTLDTNFYFREKDKADVLNCLNKTDLVIIYGAAGIGKSRLAIECFKELQESNKKLKGYCVFNKNIDLFRDIQSYFSNSGEYLIFLDDANRCSGFQYALQLFQTKRDDQSFKLIVTVRDYALDFVESSCKPYVEYKALELSKFSDKEISEFLRSEFDILNEEYLTRICEISDGNPRLSVMAAKIAKQTNKLSSIHDVSEIYESYFESIRSDLDKLGDSSLVSVAGLIAFFRSVDVSDSAFMEQIEQNFGLTRYTFKELGFELLNSEIVEVHDGEIFKITDQVLSTYLFYLAFIKNKKLSFETLLVNYFPIYKRRLVDALNPVLSSFNSEFVIENIRGAVDNVWANRFGQHEEGIYQFIEVFWFINPEKTLLYVKDCIGNYDTNVKETEKSTEEVELLTCMNILPHFWFWDRDYASLAIDLYLSYFEKEPRALKALKEVFCNELGFSKDAYKYNYEPQTLLIAKLISKSPKGDSNPYHQLFIMVASDYLQICFSRTSAGRNNTVNWSEFLLVCNESLRELRASIFAHLFALAQFMVHRDSVLRLLYEYGTRRDRFDSLEIRKNDFQSLKPFLEDFLNERRLVEGVVAIVLCSRFKDVDIDLVSHLMLKFRTKHLGLYDCIFNKLDRAEYRLDSDAFLEYKTKKVEKVTSGFELKDYSDFLQQLVEFTFITGNSDSWNLQQGWLAVMNTLTGCKFALYEGVLKAVIDTSSDLKIQLHSVIQQALKAIGRGHVELLLSNTSSDVDPDALRLMMYEGLTDEQIDSSDVESLVSLYETAETSSFSCDLRFVQKYESKEEGAFRRIVQAVVSRGKGVGWILSGLFNEHIYPFDSLINKYRLDVSLLEQAYIISANEVNHLDYSGKALSSLLDFRLDFITEYLKATKSEGLSKEDSRDYTFIWLRDDRSEIIRRVNEYFLEAEDRYSLYRGYSVFFGSHHRPLTNEIAIKNQDDYLISLISIEGENEPLMALVFSYICGLNDDRKFRLYSQFITGSKSVEAFKNIRLFPSFMSGDGGSFVPELSSRVKFLERLISQCKTIDLLEHKAYLKDEKRLLTEQIEWHKRRDFTEEFF